MSDDNFREEINNVCRESIEDIQFLKQQQWRIVYYCLLLFGAIFFLVRFLIYDCSNPLIHHKSSFQVILSVLSNVIAFIGLYFLIDLQKSIQKNRGYIAYIRNRYFRKETRILFKLDKEDDIKKYCSFWKDWKYLIAFSSTIIIALGLIIFMICESLCLMIELIALLIVFSIIVSWEKTINFCKNKVRGKMNKTQKMSDRGNKKNKCNIIFQSVQSIGVIAAIIFGAFAIYQGNEAVKMSENNYKLARGQFILSNRPYLHADFEKHFGYGKGTYSKEVFGGGKLYLKNAGEIPANIVTAEYNVVSDEKPNTDIMNWFEEDRGGFPHITLVFPKKSDLYVKLTPMIGRNPKLVFISAIITYTGVNQKKIYWYKFNRLYYIEKLPKEPNQWAEIALLKSEEDWDRNKNIKIPKFEKPDWDFYIKKLEPK